MHVYMYNFLPCCKYRCFYTDAALQAMYADLNNQTLLKKAERFWIYKSFKVPKYDYHKFYHQKTWQTNKRTLQLPNSSEVWARGRCRISPPRFLAECCKRQLNQGSFVLLYFRLFTFFWFVLSLFICIFLYCFVCQYQSSDWLWRPPPKWPILCWVGR